MSPYLRYTRPNRRLHVADLERRASEAEAKLKRLYDAIENGVIAMSEPSLDDRIAELTATRDEARALRTGSGAYREDWPRNPTRESAGLRIGGAPEAAPRRRLIRS